MTYFLAIIDRMVYILGQFECRGGGGGYSWNSQNFENRPVRVNPPQLLHQNKNYQYNILKEKFTNLGVKKSQENVLGYCISPTEHWVICPCVFLCMYLLSHALLAAVLYWCSTCMSK
jgi:hypothetical protein